MVDRRGVGAGPVTLLTLMFIGLKLGSVIGWSWWWVLSPIWISIGIGVVVLFFAMILSALGAFD